MMRQTLSARRRSARAPRTNTRTRPTRLDVLNAGLVRIVVGPGQSITIADTIENVMIRRGDQMIKPLKPDHRVPAEERPGQEGRGTARGERADVRSRPLMKRVRGPVAPR